GIYTPPTIVRPRRYLAAIDASEALGRSAQLKKFCRIKRSILRNKLNVVEKRLARKLSQFLIQEATMMRRVSVILKQNWALFLRETGAAVMPTFAVAIIPLFALMGAAVDYSAANRIQSKLQASLDTAVLAGARDNTASWMTKATNAFNATFQSP